jgi:aminomethyltransferase
MTGYTALQEHAAWLEISSRGSIRAAGADRLRLINAISTNDVAGLSPGQGTYAFFLDAQGHILADARIFAARDHVLLDCEPERADFLFGHLDRYIIMDDVTIENLAASRALIAIEGPHAETVARAVVPGEMPASEPFSHAAAGPVGILRTSLTGQPGVWLTLPAEQRYEYVSRLETEGAVAASGDDFRVVRVENRKPRHGEDFGEQCLAQESGQMHAVSFTKGCYLGQEIVERVRSRGQVHRRLAAIEWGSTSPPAAGSPVEFEGREAGRVSSPVFSPRRGLSLSFSILRSEAAMPGAKLLAAGIEGRAIESR